MNSQSPSKILSATVASSILLTLTAFAIWDEHAALGAAVAGVVACVNAYAIHWVTSKASTLNPGGLAGLVLFKTIALLVSCWICIVKIGVDFNGFTLGIGALVLGVLLGSALTPKASNVAETSATKDREHGIA